ncbi:MAG: GvpL/GvpF family gas vesicle protein [Gemmatimonadota bacterium]
MADESESLIYLYGLTAGDAADPPSELTGVEDAPVEVVRVGSLGAIVSRVPADAYSDDALNARLDDLAWVGARGVSHERVLDWFAEHGPVIPLSLFSLHGDLVRLERRIGSEQEAFGRSLERLRGRKEWGIKLWRHEADAGEGIDRLSPSLQEIGRQIDEAPAGKRFLLEKKRQAMRLEELRLVSNRIAHELFADLRGVSDGATSVPIPGVAPAAERVLLLHAAYLVADDGFEEFQRAVTEQAGRLAGSGFEIEFTGPWPAYNFASTDDE